MKLFNALTVLLIGTLTTTTLHAQGHAHGGDFVVGVSGGGQLMFEFDEDILNGSESIVLPAIDPPTPGVLEGWASNQPGFGHLEDDEPGEDFFTLQLGVDVWLVGVALDPALYVRSPSVGSPVAISPSPTLGSLQLGDHELHTHAIWHVDSLASGFDALQTEWQGTFKLVDFGSTGYGESSPFTLTFTTVPEPASLGLLMMGSLIALRKRRS